MNATTQSATEWLMSDHVTNTLARQAREEVVRENARPLQDRMLDWMHEAGHDFCIEFNAPMSPKYRAVAFSDTEQQWRAVRGPDTPDERHVRHFDDVEEALRWAFGK